MSENEKEQSGDESVDSTSQASAPDTGPKLTVGRQVHYYFDAQGDPHAATVAAVKEDGLTLAVLCPHDERLIFKKGVQYSESPKARHYSMPPMGKKKH